MLWLTQGALLFAIAGGPIFPEPQGLTEWSYDAEGNLIQKTEPGGKV